MTYAIFYFFIQYLGAGAAFSATYNTITKDYLSHKLTDALCSDNLNVYFNMNYVEDGSPNIFNSDWNNWNGQYINRIIGNTVLNANVGLFGYDINGQDDSKVFELNLIDKYAKEHYGYDSK